MTFSNASSSLRLAFPQIFVVLILRFLFNTNGCFGLGTYLVLGALPGLRALSGLWAVLK